MQQFRLNVRTLLKETVTQDPAWGGTRRFNAERMRPV
jgi:hypothetical protein